MSFFLAFDINFFSAILLIVLYVTMKLRGETVSVSNKLFFRVLWMNVFLLVLEVFSWMFDGVQGQYFLNYLTNFSFAWSTSIITCLLAAYIDYQVYGSFERLKKRLYYIHPFIATGILLMINFFTPVIFSIDAQNVYSREPLMMLLPVINVITFSYVTFLAYKERKHIQKEIVWVTILYLIMPAIAAFVQVLYFGIFILWPMMAVAVVLTYIFLETISTSKDYLTGLINRKRMDDYLDYLLIANKPFVLVMIDLDNFKTINDTYGHLSGDGALKLFSQALKHHFRKEKIGRYAGDEFILILENTEYRELENKVNMIRREMLTSKENKDIPYIVDFSYGAYQRTIGDNIDYTKIVNTVDQLMYKNKGHSSKGK